MYIQPVEFIESQIGPLVYPTNDQYVGGALRATGEYSPSEYKLIQQLVRPGWTCVDVGANIGTITLAMTRAKRVIAFEPQHFIHRLLECNLAMNSPYNTMAIKAAVGAEPGEINIPLFDYQKLDNYGAVSYNNWGTGEATPIVTLDELEEEVNFIKVDAEGMEIDVLKGAKNIINKYKPLLWVENDKPDKSRALIDYIYSINYTPYWVITRVTEQTGSPFVGQASFNMLCVTGDSVKVEGFPLVGPDDNNQSATPDRMYFCPNPYQK